MLTLSPATRIYLAAGATDLRKSFAGLSDLVPQQFPADPRSGHRGLFVNRQRHRLKVLYCDGTGMWVCAKRLGRGTVAWPKPGAPGAVRILAEELTLLWSGIDLERTQARQWWRPTG